MKIGQNLGQEAGKLFFLAKKKTLAFIFNDGSG
jgi:hypothetical protein